MTGRGRPLASIVIPTKNRRKLLTETLASIQAQTCPDWEVIVVDDGSTDNTPETVAALSAVDPRIRYYHREGTVTGAPTCRNQGLAAAVSEHVIFVDSDNLLAPHCIENRLAAVAQNPGMDFVVSQCQVFTQQPGDTPALWNSWTTEADLDRFLAFDAPWDTISVTWKREAINQIGGWDVGLICWQDQELHVRALLRDLQYAKVPREDCYWRMTANDRSSIGADRHSPAHLRCQEQILAGWYTLLRDTHQLNKERRQHLAGQYFCVALSAIQHSTKSGIEVWRRGRDHEIVGALEHWVGSVYLRARQARGGWRIRNLLTPFLVKRYRAFAGSTTLFKSPLPSQK